MKKFLKNILLFISPFVLLAYPIDIIISNQLKKDNSYSVGEYSTWNDLYNSNINSEIVIYGSSRAWVHIDPELLEKGFKKTTYNLGVDGHNFWIQYLRHKTLLKYNTKPKYIIISVDVFSLGKRNDLYNLDQFLPYMLFDTDIIEYTSSYVGFSDLDYYIPLSRFVGKKGVFKSIMNNFKNSFDSEPYRIKGFKGMDRRWNNDLEKAKKKNKLYQIEQDPKSIELFDKFLNECEKSDIKVIFVYTPEYIDGQTFVKNRNEIILLFDAFSEKYKIPFLNYSNDEICTKKEYFYNASHLNKKGAEIFTKNLVSDLKANNLILK